MLGYFLLAVWASKVSFPWDVLLSEVTDVRGGLFYG